MKRSADLTKLVKTFIKNLRTRRKAMGLTQERLADKSDFSTNYVARLELGKSVPSLATLAQLAKALRMSVSDLFVDESETTSSDKVCSALLLPLNEREREYVVAHVRNLVDFLLSHREMQEDDQEID
jgi:transcriptional regulator with XRE-family HTH domain